MTRLLVSVLSCTVLLLASQSQAVLIDQYNFDDGTINDSSGNPATIGANPNNNLTAVGATPDLTGGSYHSDGIVANRLERLGGAGIGNFTVSVWVKGGLSDQGDFQGIFSNNTNAGAANSFQIDSNNGTYRLVSAANPTRNIGTARANEWDHIVVQKFGGNNGRIFLNGVQADGNAGAAGLNLDYNPGGLQAYRIGANRNADNNNSFFGLIDNVQIFNDSTTSAAALFAAGPGIVDPRPVAALNYDARLDNNGNNTWEEVNQFVSPGQMNASLNNVTDNGDAFRFNGNGVANIGPNRNFDSAAQVTPNFTTKSASFEILFSADDLTDQQVLFEIGGGGNGSSITLDGTTLQLIAKTGGTSGVASSSIGNFQGKIENGEFLHAVGVIDIDSDLVSLFVNGELVSQMGFTGNDWAGGDAAGIGGDAGGVGGTSGALGNLDLFADLTGEIGFFRLYEGALNASDVAALAQNHLLIPEPTTGLLVLLAGGACLRRRRQVA